MTMIYRYQLTQGELEPIDGPVPVYGNPAAAVNGFPVPPRQDGQCRRCDVQWRLEDSPVCWVCGLPPQRVAIGGAA